MAITLCLRGQNIIPKIQHYGKYNTDLNSGLKTTVYGGKNHPKQTNKQKPVKDSTRSRGRRGNTILSSNLYAMVAV